MAAKRSDCSDAMCARKQAELGTRICELMRRHPACRTAFSWRELMAALGWKADAPRTSLLRSNGEGNRSAVRLSGGGASAGFAEAMDDVRDGLGVRKYVCG